MSRVCIPSLLLAVSLVVLATPATASAQCSLTFKTVEITDSATDNKLDTTELNQYFNKARCQCGSKLKITMYFSGYTSSCSSAEVIIYAGRNCYNTSTLQFDTSACTKVWGATLQGNWGSTAEVFDIPAYNLMGGSSCPSMDNQNNSLFLYVQGSGSTSQWTEASKFDYTVDTTPPAAPVAKSVTSGEALVDVDFSSHTTSTGLTDAGSTGVKDTYFKGYQILCEELDSSGKSVGPAFTSPPSPEYEASVNLCGTVSPDGGTYDSGVYEAGVSDMGADVASTTFLPGPTPLAAGDEGEECKTGDICNLGLYCKDVSGTKYCVKIKAGTEGGLCLGDAGVMGTCDTGLICTNIGSKYYCLKPNPDAGTTPDLSVSDLSVADKCVGECVTPDAGVSDGGTVTASAGLTSLDKRYVCSKKITSPGAIRITGLKNKTTYAFYVLTIDTLKNPSSLTKVGTGTPVYEEDFWERYKRAGGQADGEYCFVATAAYGDYGHPHVRVLRDFRDEVLMPTEAGRAMVEAYYQHAPGPASWLARHDTARAAARAALWPVTVTAGAVVFTSGADKMLLLLAGFMMLYLHITSRRRSGGSKGGRA